MGARSWIEALGGDARTQAVEAEIRAELEAHLALAEEALRAQGRTHDEARTEARARFGDLERTLRACRRERMGGRLMLVRIQWLVIALLGLTTVALAMYGRSEAMNAAAARDHFMVEAMSARAQMEELLQRVNDAKAPVDQIVVGVGDVLHVQLEFGEVLATAEVQRDGQALFNGIGWLPVAGKSRPEVEDLLTARYAPHYENAPRIYVIVKSPE